MTGAGPFLFMIIMTVPREMVRADIALTGIKPANATAPRLRAMLDQDFLMLKRLRHLLAMFFVVWLPLQSATAWAMPMGSCVHSTKAAAGADSTDAAGNARHVHHANDAHEASALEGHHHDHDAGVSPDAHAHHPVLAASAQGGVASDAVATIPAADGCNDCGLCQFACASALTSSLQRLPVLRPEAVADTSTTTFHSTTPSLLQRPPRPA